MPSHKRCVNSFLFFQISFSNKISYFLFLFENWYLIQNIYDLVHVAANNFKIIFPNKINFIQVLQGFLLLNFALGLRYSPLQKGFLGCALRAVRIRVRVHGRVHGTCVQTQRLHGGKRAGRDHGRRVKRGTKRVIAVRHHAALFLKLLAELSGE